MANQELENMAWDSNADHIIEEDETAFFKTRHSLEPQEDLMLAQDANELDVSTASWGHYFFTKSPDFADIFDTDCSNAKSVDTTQERKDRDSFFSTSSECSSCSLTNIQVSSLKHVQRFYQFSVKASHKAKIESILKQFVESCSAGNGQAQLSAVIINDDNQCTALTMLPSTRACSDNNDETSWIDEFLGYKPIVDALDHTKQPSFTQLSE